MQFHFFHFIKERKTPGFGAVSAVYQAAEAGPLAYLMVPVLGQWGNPEFEAFWRCLC